jgi:hypothetical protein
VVTREKVRRVLDAMDRAQLAVAVGVAGIDAVSGSRMW